MSKLTTCKVCNHEVAQNSKRCINCGAAIKKPFYKRWWVWTFVGIVGICCIAQYGNSNINNVAPNQAESTTVNQNVASTPKATTNTKTEPTVPTEYLSALTKAKIYSETMYMSKKGLYEQLTSEYGEKFSTKAAQYAVDHINADWKLNALQKAKTYQNTMSMSPAAIHDQLTSEAGEKFTQEEADYAIKNLE